MTKPVLHLTSLKQRIDLGEVILLCKALRIWSQARQEGEPAQPALFALLDPHGRGLLAPVYDGLFTCVGAALGRPLATGCGCAISADEAVLATLVYANTSVTSGSATNNSEHAALARAAVRCAQIMLRSIDTID